MTSRLFARACRVIVAGVEVQGLRVSFKVKKTLKKEPNEAEVKIYNLSPAHRTALQKKGEPFLLEAGYGTDLRHVFTGDIRFGDSVREGPDWVTKIQSGDGERAYKFATISETFGKNTPVRSVAGRVLNAMGIDSKQAVDSLKTLAGQFVRGYVAHGKASVELDQLLKGTGLNWSIQDGRVQILGDGAAAAGEALVLSSATGLIGSPEHGTPENEGDSPVLKVKSLLQPQLKPGGVVRMDSLNVKGDFRVETITHQGDTFGQDWYSDMELRQL